MYRMHAEVCEPISELFYEEKLGALTFLGSSDTGVQVVGLSRGLSLVSVKGDGVWGRGPPSPAGSRA